jgi:hypothetical protein
MAAQHIEPLENSPKAVVSANPLIFLEFHSLLS